MNTMTRYINDSILKMAKDLRYTVKSEAPSTESALFTQPTLVVWDGASDNTIYNDPTVNFAFRAIHDSIHLKTGLGFSPKHEIEMGRIQANAMGTNALLTEVFYIEIAKQAEYYLNNGIFVQDQVKFFNKYLKF